MPVSNKRGRATREQLLSAAEQCLARKGAATTMEEIAAQAGRTRITAYRHFESRDHLLMTVFARGWAELSVELAKIAEKTPTFEERLVEGIALSVKELRARPHIAWALSPTTLGTHWEDVDTDRRFRDLVASFMRPYFLDAKREGILMADVDESIEWIQRQILLLFTMPLNSGTSLEEIQRHVRTFIVPSILCKP